MLPIKLRLSNAHGASMRTFYLRLSDPKPVVSGLGLSSTTPVVGSLLRASPTVSGPPGPHSLVLRVANASGSAFLARSITVLQPLIRDFRPVCPNLLCLFPIGTAVAFELVLDPAAQPVRLSRRGLGECSVADPVVFVSLHVYTEPGNYRPRVRITTVHGAETRLASQFLLVTR